MGNGGFKSLQFDLWQECNNGCSFCFLCDENKKTENDIKVQNLKKVFDIISDESNYQTYQAIGFLGGEFFQGQLDDVEVHTQFFNVMRKTADLYNCGMVKQVWIPATLTIGHQRDLYDTLDLFDSWDNVWVITSWDTVGRFKTQKMLSNWDHHVKNLHKRYPGIKINITTILTTDFIQKYLNNEISLKRMAAEYNASLYFKHSIIILNKASEDTIEAQMQSKILSNKLVEGFFPKRSLFLKFLVEFRHRESSDMWERLFGVRYRSDKLYRFLNDGSIQLIERYKDKKADVSDSVVSDCGHPMVYRAYIDSDACVMCDKQKIEQSYLCM